jgi:hypothetical protein
MVLMFSFAGLGWFPDAFTRRRFLPLSGQVRLGDDHLIVGSAEAQFDDGVTIVNCACLSTIVFRAG